MVKRRFPIIEVDQADIDRLLGHALGARTTAPPTLMVDGMIHTIYRLETDGGAMVLRCYPADHESSCAHETRVYELMQGTVPVPELLCAEPEPSSLGCPLSIWRWCHGTSLEQRLRDGIGEAEGARLAASLARAAAAIHAIECPELRTYEWLPWMHTFTADELVKTHLDAETIEQLHAFAEREVGAATIPEPQRRLVHADFKGDNILVDDGEVTAVLDWEFAHRGNPMQDIGQLYRAEDRFPPGFTAAFTTAYRERGGWLPDDWRRRARIRDVIAQVQKLTRPAHRDTAESQRIIRETLDLLG